MRMRDGFVTLAAIAGTLAIAPDAVAQDGPRGGGGRARHGAPVPPPLPLPAGTGRLRNAARNMCLDVAGWAAQGNQRRRCCGSATTTPTRSGRSRRTASCATR